MKEIIKKLNMEIEYRTDLEREFENMKSQITQKISEETVKIYKQKVEAEVKKTKLIYIYVLKNQIKLLLDLDVHICKNIFNKVDRLFFGKEYSLDGKCELDKLDEYVLKNFGEFIDQINHNLIFIRDYARKEYREKEDVENKIKNRVKEFYDALVEWEEKLIKED